MKLEKIILFGVLIIVGIIIGAFIPFHVMSNMETKREFFITLKKDIQSEMLSHGKYKCCLEKPCVYCIEKTPGHGEGAECSCLEDIYNGVHPCGECIGEILEGHGNKYVSEYFASAIAEEVGIQHLDTLKQIISEKYDISVEEQV